MAAPRTHPVRERVVVVRSVLAAALVAAATVGCSDGRVTEFEAIDFASGVTVGIGSMRGDPVLLAGWATWCVPCERELPELDAYAATADPDLQVVAVNVDAAVVSDDEVRAMIDRLSVSLPVWRDPDGLLLTTYDSSMMPFAVLLGRDGRVVRTWNGALDLDTDDFTAAIAESLV